MSPRRTRKTAMRENVSNVSMEKTAELSMSNRSVRASRRVKIADDSLKTSMIEDIVKSAKKTRNPKKKVESLISEDDLPDSQDAVEISGKKAKKNNKKKVESVVSADDSQDSVVTSGKKVSRKSRKKADSLISEDDFPVSQDEVKVSGKKLGKKKVELLVSEDDSPTEKEKKAKKKRQTKTSAIGESLISEDDSNEAPRPTRSRKKMEKSEEKENIEENQKPKRKRTQNDVCITPKSSPIVNVSLTPNRSTKTPRRSPVNIGSPKSHSTSSREFLNVSKKLDIDCSPATDSSEDVNMKKKLSDISNTPPKRQKLSINLIPVEFKKEDRPSGTSTPREKPKEASTSSISKSKIRLSEKLWRGTPVRLNKAANLRRSISAAKHPKPSAALDESSLMRMSDVFDSDASIFNETFNLMSEASKNKGKSPNKTFEVNEPKTPALSMTKDKRQKKSCKVRFATPDREMVPSVTLNRVGTPGVAMHKRKISVTLGQKVPTSLTRVQNPAMNSTSKANSSMLNRTNNSESSVKKSAVKKIPNFADIHKKNFNKMESLVDLKNRVKVRHQLLNSVEKKKVVSTTKITTATPTVTVATSKDTKPTTAEKGSYNRFGYKLKKEKATQIMNSKTTISKNKFSEKKREETRSVLKGVRMNRRFELQIQARNRMQKK